MRLVQVENRDVRRGRVYRKGGRRDALAIKPQTATRLCAYATGPGDNDGPPFRPLKHNGKRREERRGMRVGQVWETAKAHFRFGYRPGRSAPLQTRISAATEATFPPARPPNQNPYASRNSSFRMPFLL